MLITAETRDFEGSKPSAHTDDEAPGSIPARYRDRMGGINLERVRRDQRRARLQVVRGLIRHLSQLRNRGQ